jgi:hypothetical protein
VTDELKNDDQVLAVRRWVESVVIELNLCPFAKRELIANRVRFFVTEASTEEDLLETLASELTLLGDTPSIETTLIIHPKVLCDFGQYNQFLDKADRLLVQMELQGVFQIASFHPNYQFAGTGPDDAENFTNRSPYPILHLLREESVEKDVAHTAAVEKIPLRNTNSLEFGICIFKFVFTCF